MMIAITKTCGACGRQLALENFNRDKSSKDGRDRRCRECGKANYQKYYKKNRNQVCEKRRAARAAAPEDYRRKQREWAKKNPGVYRRLRLKSKYGITEAQYNETLEEQNGVCAICGQEERRTRNKKRVSLSVDHCHESGEVRGLICYDCNTMLGMSRDDSEILEKGAEYLRNRSVHV